MDKKILEHENARLLLEEGWKLFQKKGFKGVSVDELCEKCRLTKPTLYYYFSNKENLFVEVLCYKLEGFHMTIDEQGTLFERLNRTAEIILDSFESEYGLLMRDMGHIKKPENVKIIKDAFWNELFAPIESIMKIGIENGELAGEDSRLLAYIYMGMVNNFIGRVENLGIEKSYLSEYIANVFLKGAMKK